MKVYLSGPMRGKPFYNFAEFDRVAKIVRELGHEPVNPADLSRAHVRALGLDPQDETSYTHGTPEQYMERDIQAMRDVEGLLLLPHWFESKGVAVELAYARYRNIPVFSSVEQFELITLCRQAAA